MPVQKLQVFLAGRFDEFADLRNALRDRINKVRRPEVEAVDLNDNLADHHPPIVRCYEAVERAEIIVLLVGETYGEEVEGHRASYTHLEYRHAHEDGRTILAYDVRSSPGKPSDSRVRDWLKEIESNQTVSRMDITLGPERLASDIFESVFERLWEIAAEGDVPGDDDVDENGRGWDESPIKRDQLNRVPRPADAASHPLKALAAGHASQAFDALALNMPETAIHQLRKAVDLSPLEIVPAYWLARMLIATGRFVDCREGLRLALRCANIASQRDDAPDLAGMAALILAARASERLNDADGALGYAQAAHEEKSHHWLAKVELGRQYALKGMSDDALKYAGEAFWLRPDAIQKIQGDPAYRDLGQPFDDFRRRLRDKVQSDTEEILRVEVALRELAATRSGDTAESIPSEPTPDDGRKPSLLHVVRLARFSARRSLELVRKWAAQLAGEVRSFTVGSYKGLNQATQEQIQQSIEGASTNVVTLEQKLRTEKEAMARASQETLYLALAAFLAVILLGAGIWNYASNSEWGIFALLVVLSLFAFVGFSMGYQSIGSRNKTAEKNCAQLGSKLQQAQATLAALNDAGRQFDIRAAEICEETRRFCTAVNAFEKAAARRLPFAPAVPRLRRDTTDIIRIDDEEAAEDGVLVDRDLLPADLKYLVMDGSPPTATHWFVRRVGTRTPDYLNRSAAYFPV